MSTWYTVPSNDDLMHHGVKGMKWGVRHDPKPGTGSSMRKTGTNSAFNSRNNATGSSYMPSNIHKRGDSNVQYSPNYRKVSDVSRSSANRTNSLHSVNNSSKTGSSNTGFNAAGGAALVGGASVKDMEEMEELWRKFNSGKTLTAAEIEVFRRVLGAMEKGNKNAYEQFISQNPGMYKVINKGYTAPTSNRGGWTKKDETITSRGSGNQRSGTYVGDVPIDAYAISDYARRRRQGGGGGRH